MQIEFISIIIAVFPTIYFLFFFHSKDKSKKNPINTIFPIFFLGMFSMIPVLLIETVIGSINDEYFSNIFITSFITSFIIAGCCEEGAKFIIIRKFVYDNAHFNSIMDGIIYTIAASLGFACIENISYTLSMGSDVGYMRAFTAVPLHVCASGIMGYYIGKAKIQNNPKMGRFYLKKGFIRAVMIHGTYNFFLFLSIEDSQYTYLNILIFPILIISFIFLYKKVNEHSRDNSNKVILEPDASTIAINILALERARQKPNKKNTSSSVKEGYEKGDLYN